MHQLPPGLLEMVTPSFPWSLSCIEVIPHSTHLFSILYLSFALPPATPGSTLISSATCSHLCLHAWPVLAIGIRPAGQRHRSAIHLASNRRPPSSTSSPPPSRSPPPPACIVPSACGRQDHRFAPRLRPCPPASFHLADLPPPLDLHLHNPRPCAPSVGRHRPCGVKNRRGVRERWRTGIGEPGFTNTSKLSTSLLHY